ncbi:MAG: alkaline phosphatase D family protein, partial [Gemmatimonadota bacterium]
RTAPAAGARVDSFLFAFASCQNFQAGYYTAHRHMAEEDLRLVVHLGDYIYEGGVGQNMPRAHDGPEIVTLQDYRDRYALYKSDPDLQAAHAAAAWSVTWDDHEVDNNYAGDLDQDGTAPEAFLQRRAAAYQAFYENMPLRRASMPIGSDLRLYRRLTFGDLAEINVLDTRQYRTDQPCGDGFHSDCSGALDPDATILGPAQEKWLLDGLGRSRSRWNVLANQVPIAQIDRGAGPEEIYQMDKWDGYIASRDRVTHFIRDRSVSNPVVITGDVHVSWVADVKTDYQETASHPVATEFVGTSISSGGDGSDMTAAGEAMLAENPHMKYFNGQRGYVRCALTPEHWVSDYRVVDYVSRRGAPIRDQARFVVEHGRPGAQEG